MQKQQQASKGAEIKKLIEIPFGENLTVGNPLTPSCVFMLLHTTVDHSECNSFLMSEEEENMQNRVCCVYSFLNSAPYRTTFSVGQFEVSNQVGILGHPPVLDASGWPQDRVEPRDV